MKDRAHSFTDRDINLFGTKYRLSTLLRSALVANSLIVLIGNNLANFFAYIYQLVMARLLGPTDYGELAAFVSIIALIGLAYSFFNLVIVKYSATFTLDENASFFHWIRKLGVIAATLTALILFLISNPIAVYINVDTNVAMVISPVVSISVVAMIYKSFLQGQIKFKQIVITNNFELIMRLLISCVLIYFGLEVFGATLGYLISVTFGFFLSAYFLRYLRRHKVSRYFSHKKDIFKYTIPVFVAYIAMNSFFTTDVILAKHYLPPHEAGIYAGLSNFGKILYFAASPIAVVMFPIVAKKYKQGGNYKSILYLSIMFSVGIMTAVLGLYYFYPSQMVNILLGNDYKDAVNHLMLFGMFMALYTIAILLINYFLSINKTKIVYWCVVVSLGQIIGILVFHNDIFQIIRVSVLASAMLLFGAIIYLVTLNKNEKKT